LTKKLNILIQTIITKLWVGSGIQKKTNPDPGVKKTLVPGYGSAKLIIINATNRNFVTKLTVFHKKIRDEEDSSHAYRLGGRGRPEPGCQCRTQTCPPSSALHFVKSSFFMQVPVVSWICGSGPDLRIRIRIHEIKNGA